MRQYLLSSDSWHLSRSAKEDGRTGSLIKESGKAYQKCENKRKGYKFVAYLRTLAGQLCRHISGAISARWA
jgi:hypothetical protein